MNTRVRELLAIASERLAEVSETPQLDAEVLMSHLLGRDRSWLYAWPDHRLDEAQLVGFAQLIDARADGRPVAHLTGRREFWSLPISVNEHTLIPRPETEQLVEIALSLELTGDARVLDLGTGSGAIALALATHRPTWRITAVDSSAAALDVARDNARRLGTGGIHFVQGDWFAGLPGDAPFDLIVGNPPYIAAADPHLGTGDVAFEPLSALAAGDDGLADLRRIIADAPPFLRSGSWLWLEHGYDQAIAVADLLRTRGFADIQTRVDLAGQPRHSGGRWLPDLTGRPEWDQAGQGIV